MGERRYPFALRAAGDAYLTYVQIPLVPCA